MLSHTGGPTGGDGGDGGCGGDGGGVGGNGGGGGVGTGGGGEYDGGGGDGDGGFCASTRGRSTIIESRRAAGGMVETVFGRLLIFIRSVSADENFNT